MNKTGYNEQRRFNEIKQWLNENFTGIHSVSFDENGEINLEGWSIKLINPEMTKLKYKFNEVRGDFFLGKITDAPYKQSQLSTLENCPRVIYGDFSCRQCANLTSLEGGPEKVTGHYLASSNALRNLKGIARYIGKSISVYNNRELDDISEISNINSDFYFIDCDFCCDSLKDTLTYKELKKAGKILIQPSLWD